jgi:hypothetical protein
MPHVNIQKCIDRAMDEGFEQEAKDAENELKILVDDAIAYRDLKSGLKLKLHEGVISHYITPLQGQVEILIKCVKHLVFINQAHDQENCGTCHIIQRVINTGKVESD